MAKKYDENELIARCTAAVRAVYGESRAAKSEIYYSRGWFYVMIAREFPDGSVGRGGMLPDGLRYSKMMDLILELEGRAQKIGKIPSPEGAGNG